MMLRPRAVVTSLLVAVPATALFAFVIDRGRMGDMELAVERVVRSQINEQVRERCESDPMWFFTGPLLGRPRGGVFQDPSPDALPPRPKVSPQPFELFAYDQAFIGSSTASPRFPADFRRDMRSDSTVVKAPYATDTGTGVQVAMATGWTGGPCMYLLGRMEPPPNQMRQRLLTIAALFGTFFLVAFAASLPMVRRIRRLASHARESADAGYTSIAPDRMRDELSSLTFMYNDASTELHQRKTRIDDQEEAVRRFVQSTEDEVAMPLAALEAQLAVVATRATPSRDELNAALRQAHNLSGEVENLTSAARLRLIGPTPPTMRIDLNAVVTRVIARHMPLAQAGDVALHLKLPPSTVNFDGDEPLIERAISNVVDNAVRYTGPGGEVSVSLEPLEGGRKFKLRVTDTGRGVSEEEYKGLTAIRRFRGDEGRNRRAGAPGLGLAVAREVSDRFKIQMELKRPGPHGFEVEFTGPV